MIILTYHNFMDMFITKPDAANAVSRCAKSLPARPPGRADFATKVGPPSGMIRLWTPLPTKPIFPSNKF
jgi:hypothetical protein